MDEGNDWVCGDRVRVGVWFGEYLIREWQATPAEAEQYAAVVRREFWGLRVAVAPLPPGEARQPLPAPSWWLRVPT
jgi:hypothetical protein